MEAEHRTESPFFDDPLNPAVAAMLILVGIGIFAHPLYLWPHYAQSNSTLVVEQLDGSAEEFIEYETLPADARTAFQRAVTDGRQVLWSGEDDRAIDVFEEQPTIQYEGEYYQVYIGHRDDAGYIDIVVRWFGTAAGAFLIAYGGLVLCFGSWRPFTPVRSLWIPAVVLIGFSATNAYDVLHSGAHGSIWNIAGTGVVQLIPITSSFLAVGSEVAVNGRNSRPAILGSVVILLLGAVSFGSISIGLLIAGLYAVIGGIPWFWLGYRMTGSS